MESRQRTAAGSGERRRVLNHIHTRHRYGVVCVYERGGDEVEDPTSDKWRRGQRHRKTRTLFIGGAIKQKRVVKEGLFFSSHAAAAAARLVKYVWAGGWM